MKPLYDEIAAARLSVRRPRWALPYRYTRWRWRVLFAIVDFIGWCVFGPPKLLRRYALAFRGTAEPQSILVIQLDHLGDAVMSLGLLRYLRQRYPAARLEVICGAWNRELFEAVGGVDQVHVMQVTRFSRQRGPAWLFELLRWGWRLRQRKFDLAIDVRGEFPHALLMWLAGARRRLGWASGGGGFLLTDRLRHTPGRHEVLARRDILSALGSRVFLECVPCDLGGTSHSMDAMGVLSESSTPFPPLLRACHPAQPLIALHVGAGTQAKRWPAEHWKELASQLTVEFDARMVLVGGSEDGALGSQVSHALPNVQDWTGRLSLVQLADLLRQSHLFVGADSGPAHLAAAVSTPVVALFSGTNDPEQWKPWGPRVAVVRHAPACAPCHRETCPWADHPCMHRLRPAAVMEAIRPFLTPHFPQFPLPASRKEQRHGHPSEPATA